jgi:arylsulfatase A-like enzyme
MLPLLLLTSLLLGAAPQETPPPRPGIVVVTIDTLRREHLGCYGYPRATSPRIDALAAESILFEEARAPMATTFPSHLSLLTGLYPHEHGCTSNRGAARDPYRDAPGRTSAATALTASGYRTAGFVSCSVLDGRTGIGTGFEVYDFPKLTSGRRVARDTMERALAWLADVPPDQPFFLWVHLFDVHEPNEPEPEYARMLAPDETLRAWVAARGLDPALIAERAAGQATAGQHFFGQPPPPESDEPGSRRARRARQQAQAPAAPLAIDAESLVDLHARYDASVRQVDDQVGRLIDALRARGGWDSTAFVFTADHGQSLGEHGLLGHGLNREVNVRIPLLVKLPGRAPGRNARVVSLVDVMPTLVATLGIQGVDAYRAQFRGTDVLAPDFAREHVVTAESTQFLRKATRPYEPALVTGRWKYVKPAGGGAQLYDLAAAELVDVAASHPDVVLALDALLAAELATSVLDEAPSAPADAESDPEVEELLRQLEGLGYGGDEDED